MAMNLTELQYQGTVKLYIKVKDKVIELKKHNNGTAALQELFAKFMSSWLEKITPDSEMNRNNWNDARSYLPRYIDLRRSADKVEWSTCLLNRINITGRKAVINEDNEWVARFTSTIRYQDLIDTIDATDTDTFRFYMYTVGEDARTIVDLAYLDVTAIDVAKLSPGTQIIIEWDMKLKVEE